MMKRGDELEIEIDDTGQVRVVTHNVKGQRCLEYMEIFRQLLGPVEDEERTPEFNQVDVGIDTHTHVQQHVQRS